MKRTEEVLASILGIPDTTLLNRVRYISDTSTMYEGTIRWGLDETTHGDAAGGGAIGHAPGRAKRGSQAPNDNHQLNLLN